MMIRAYKHYKPDPHQETLEFADDTHPAMEGEVSITENNDAFALHRNFSAGSIFEQENASRRNMEKLMKGDAPEPFDWKNTEEARALIEELRSLPPKEALKKAIRAGITDLAEENSAWHFERNRMSGSGEPLHGGKKWSLLQKAHLEFIDTTRREFFVQIATETIERGVSRPAQAIAEMQKELSAAIREATEKRPKPR